MRHRLRTRLDVNVSERLLGLPSVRIHVPPHQIGLHVLYAMLKATAISSTDFIRLIRQISMKYGCGGTVDTDTAESDTLEMFESL